MKKKKRCTRVGAGALAAVLAVTAAGVSVPALAQQAVRTESQTQMSSDPELVYVNNYSSTAQRSQNFNSNWKFYFGDAGNAQGATFDDSKWEQVSLPHDYSISQEYSKSMEAESGYLGARFLSAARKTGQQICDCLGWRDGKAKKEALVGDPGSAPYSQSR